ncbi:MAG: SpoIID/LytB domain-containing protein [Phycisphaerae bacterium]|nr:SpoIID/LytB domain-containing protein [Phycisphaerae bacterium]
MAKLLDKIFRHKELIKRALVILAFVCCFVGCWKKQAYRPVIIDDKEPLRTNQVRVLLHDNVMQCLLSSTGGFSVNQSTMTSKAHFGPEQGPMEISVVTGYVKIGDRLFGNGCVIEPDAMSLLSINGELYRGEIKLFTSSDARSLRVINQLDIEEYLAGVVGAEMPSYWDRQALKAQAIAARTYCLYTKNRFGTNRQWDVRRTQANQMYGGVSAETATVKQAVSETKSMVLTCDLRNLTTGIFPTYYSSTCGGHTESSYNTFGEYFPPLNGVVCPYCKKTAQPDYLNWGPVNFTQAEITASVISSYPSLAGLEKIESIIPAKTSNYGQGEGRIVSFRLIGKDGKDAYLKGEDLRLTLDPSGTIMKSTFCEMKKKADTYSFTGKGFGHGVGMCQYGAQEMAREGKDYNQILRFYYPTAQIVVK